MNIVVLKYIEYLNYIYYISLVPHPTPMGTNVKNIEIPQLPAVIFENNKAVFEHALCFFGICLAFFELNRF